VGSASILAKAPAIVRDENLASLVAVIRDEADRLNGDIENLLDATRISSDGIRPHAAWVDPEDIVSGTLPRKWRLLGEREVVLDVADDLPLVHIDATMVESALGQIVENAAKYSAPGTPITISATHSDGVVRIKVDDQGDGLASGEAEKIFERFYRGARHAGQISGSGLGLWVARALIEACGGSVRAFSAGPKRGTTIQIDLPVEAQPADDEHADE
jgi:two-component system sensor histidine kinase KdpD